MPDTRAGKRPRGERPREAAKRRKPVELPRAAITEALLSGEGLFCAYRMHNDLPPQVAAGKLLRLPENNLAFARAPGEHLEMECRIPFLVEHEHGLAVDMLDPSVFDVEADDGQSVAVTGTNARTARVMKIPEAGGFLRKASYVVNDVFTMRDNYFTGHDAAEKKLVRTRRRQPSQEETVLLIEQTFDDAREKVKLHPGKAVTPLRVLPIFPDTDLFSHKYAQVMFDEDPMKSAVPTVLCPAPSSLTGPSGLGRLPLTAYVGTVPLADAQKQMGEGEAVDLARGITYTWENRWACELSERSHTFVRDLLLTRPAKDAPTGTPYSYNPLPALVQRCAKELTGGTKVSTGEAPSKAKLEARPPNDEERAAETNWKDLVAGTGVPADAQFQELLDAAVSDVEQEDE